jgi:hypothetical protein
MTGNQMYPYSKTENTIFTNVITKFTLLLWWCKLGFYCICVN